MYQLSGFHNISKACSIGLSFRERMISANLEETLFVGNAWSIEWLDCLK